MHEYNSLPKKYLSYPKRSESVSLGSKLVHAVKSLFAFPIYIMLAYLNGAPGIPFRFKCIQLSMRMLLKGCNPKSVYNVLVTPMDSVRYFEFDFMWNSIRNLNLTKYLDVSSPRLFPTLMLQKYPNLVADLINPDKKDLPLTKTLINKLGLATRCNFHAELISEINLEPESFDVVTCISVLEHIPNDIEAVSKMWSLVKLGGKLLISVPCASSSSEEYININEYELIEQDKDGFVFWQRYYDEHLIQQKIFNITGQPDYYEIYAEKKSGNYQANVYEKRTNPNYPYWREPFMMSQEYEYKSKLSELPGMGVIAMEFIKR